MALGQAHHAQVLQGEWVDAADKAIETHRKTDVTVIVLGQQDRPVEGASVRIVQQRHDFVLGLNLPDGQTPPEKPQERGVYRCFNAIALDRFTDWAAKTPPSSKLNQSLIAGWTKALRPIHTSFGRVVSADPSRNQDEVAALKPANLRDVIKARVDYAMAFDPKADRYAVYADLLNQDMVERKLGIGMVHRIFEDASAARPKAQLALRVSDAIALKRGRDLSKLVQRMQVRQVPLHGVTIEQRFRGLVHPKSLARMLEDYVGNLPVPVMMANLEVGGQTEVAASLNLETVLRLLYAQPNINGITFSGLYKDELVEQNAALVGDDDSPTPAGKVLDKMFQKVWRSDVTGKTDERGNADARVFTGWYLIEVKLPNGQTIRTNAYIPKDKDRPKRVVVQATAAEAG